MKRARLTISGAAVPPSKSKEERDTNEDNVRKRKKKDAAPSTSSRPTVERKSCPSAMGGTSKAMASSSIQVFLTPERITKVFEPTEEMTDAEKNRETQRVIICLSTVLRSQSELITNSVFGNILKTLQLHVDSINDENWTIVQQSIQYAAGPKMCGACFTNLQNLINEVLVHRPAYANSMIQIFLAKLVRFSTNNPVAPASMVVDDGPSVAELKCFDVANKLICRIIEVIGIKRLNRTLINMMSTCYPYVLKPPLTHHFYLRNLITINKTIGNSMTYFVLSVIFHKLTYMDSLLPREVLSSEQLQEIVLPKPEKSRNPNASSYLIPDDDADEVVLEIVKSYSKMAEEVDHTSQIATLDISLSYLISHLSTVHETISFNTLLSIFEAEVLPTFNTSCVQFAFFHLINQKEEYLNAFLEFLWKKFLNLNTSTVLRIHAVGYIAGVLARSLKVGQRTLRRWISRLTTFAHEYLNSKSSSANSHWSNVNVHAHGPFYAACQGIFYTFVFRHFELAYGNVLAKLSKEEDPDDEENSHATTPSKNASFHKLPPPSANSFIYTLNLQRLITSELNPLKACSSEVAKTFVSIAHVYQISYCKTVLDRNSRATVRNLVHDDMREVANGNDKTGANMLSDSFFPFDPLPLAYCKLIVDDHFRVYDPDSIAVTLVGESSTSKKNSSKQQPEDDDDDNCDHFDLDEDDTDSRDMLLECA